MTESWQPAWCLEDMISLLLQQELEASVDSAACRSGLITRSWIADLLLDYRLVDAKSREFRLAWILWVCITCLACLAAAAWPVHFAGSAEACCWGR